MTLCSHVLYLRVVARIREGGEEPILSPSSSSKAPAKDPTSSMCRLLAENKVAVTYCGHHVL